MSFLGQAQCSCTLVGSENPFLTGMRYASALASLTFHFPTGTLWALGAFLGGPSCGLRMLFYWICPLVTPTPTLLWLGLILPLSTHHLTYPFSLVCFFPSPPAIHLPIPHCHVWQCFTHIKHLRHQHSTSAWFASSPLPCHLFIRSPSPNRFLPQYMAHWLVWVIWVFIECES